MTIFSSPEFWVSFAFILVVMIFVHPLFRSLSRWTEKQADFIRQEQKEAKDILKKAEEIKKKYEKAYLNRFTEKQKMLQEAEREIAVLDEETHLMTLDKINRKKQELDLRLKMIEENGRQDIKSKMLSQILSDTRYRLKKRETDENMEEVLKNALNILDKQGIQLLDG